MSFLSRKPARPGDRDGVAGRDDEYDDYDLYSTDGYEGGEDSWSPEEYFSPEGIKGRWAGEHPEGRAGGRGRRGDGADGPSERDAWQDSVEDGYQAAAHGAAPGSGRGGGYPGYVADEYASGAYDLPEGADEDRPERSRRRRRERAGERTGIMRLRRDRGEDIWPDDGISDEDYWASVAADRPLNDGAPDDQGRPGAGRPAAGDQRGGPGRLGPAPGAGDGHAAGGSGLLADSTRPATGPQATRPGGGAAGRTSGPNALRPGYDQAGRTSGPNALRPGYDQAGRTSGPNAMGYAPAGRTSGPNAIGADYGAAGRTSGPNPMRANSGPQSLRPGATRPGTGAAPTVGVTASRPPAGGRASSSGPNAGWADRGQSGPGSGAFPQAARPTFQPHGYQPAGQGRSSDRDDRDEWGERTERIERVNASGYPDPRPASRGQAPAAGYPGSGWGAPSGQSGPYPRAGRDGRERAGDPGVASRGRGETGANGTGGYDTGDYGTGDYGTGNYRTGDYGTGNYRTGDYGTTGFDAAGAGGTDLGTAGHGAGGRGRQRTGSHRASPGARNDAGNWQTPGQPAPARRDAAADAGGSIWSAPARDGGTARGDDPLTSTAYSRAALSDTDGRSYRVAARRSQAQAKLTDQADPYLSGRYPAGGYQAASDYPTASFQPVGQPSGEYRQPTSSRHAGSRYGDTQYRAETAATGAQAPYGALAAQPGFSRSNGQPAGARPVQPLLADPTVSQPAIGQRPLSQPAFTPAPASTPGRAGGAHAAPSPATAQPLPAPVPSSGVPSGGAASGASGTQPPPAGLNPYGSEATGSHPYPATDPYAARPGSASTARPAAGDLYDRVSTGGAYPDAARPGPPQPGPGTSRYRPGHAAGQPGYGERPY